MLKAIDLARYVYSTLSFGRFFGTPTSTDNSACLYNAINKVTNDGIIVGVNNIASFGMCVGSGMTGVKSCMLLSYPSLYMVTVELSRLKYDVPILFLCVTHPSAIDSCASMLDINNVAYVLMKEDYKSEIHGRFFDTDFTEATVFIINGADIK